MGLGGGRPAASTKAADGSKVVEKVGSWWYARRSVPDVVGIGSWCVR